MLKPDFLLASLIVVLIPGTGGSLHDHDRSQAQMESQPGRRAWVYAWNCPSYFGKHIGIIGTSEYERTGIFCVAAGRSYLFTVSRMEYVA